MTAYVAKAVEEVCEGDVIVNTPHNIEIGTVSSINYNEQGCWIRYNDDSAASFFKYGDSIKVKIQ